MAGKWDSNFKHLVEANPEHFIEWLLPGAHYVRELNTHLNRGIDIDILYEVIFQRIRILVHLEFQRYEDAEIDKRVLEYNVFTLLNRRPWSGYAGGIKCIKTYSKIRKSIS